MNTYIYPQLTDWFELSNRPTKETQDLQQVVLNVFDEIQNKKSVSILKRFF